MEVGDRDVGDEVDGDSEVGDSVVGETVVGDLELGDSDVGESVNYAVTTAGSGNEALHVATPLGTGNFVNVRVEVIEQNMEVWYDDNLVGEMEFSATRTTGNLPLCKQILNLEHFIEFIYIKSPLRVRRCDSVRLQQCLPSSRRRDEQLGILWRN